MYSGAIFSRGRLIFAGATSALRAGDGSISQVDPVGLRFVATISVIGHWIACAVFLFEVSHHIGDETAKYSLYALLLLALVGFNGILHYRLRTNRTISWLWLQALNTWDVVLVSVWLAMSGGFGHPFIHLFYFPLLATFSVFLASFRVTMAWVTALSGVYIGISLTAGDGIDLAANDHETLLARIVVMYVVAAVVKLAGRFERMRRGQAVERELAFERERMELSQAIQRERIELSHTIHDTAAQSAYMIGLGIDTAKALAGDTNPELTATLEETSRLSRSTIWELRHPINLGGIYEGRELGRALRAHATSFTNVTRIPAEMTQTGVEPALSIETRILLYSIAHNVLTNAFRHAEASRVAVHLAFSEEDSRLSVSDDGTGLPDDYSERGSGFANMTSATERLGGRLVVEERGALGGASVTCVIPPSREGEGNWDGIG